MSSCAECKFVKRDMGDFYCVHFDGPHDPDNYLGYHNRTSPDAKPVVITPPKWCPLPEVDGD